MRALRDGDVKALKQVPGVGAKMAERMGFELRDAASDLMTGLADPDADAAQGGEEAVEDVRDQLLSALLNLGYPRAQAEKVVDAAATEAGQGATIESLIRVALRKLAR